MTPKNNMEKELKDCEDDQLISITKTIFEKGADQVLINGGYQAQLFPIFIEDNKYKVGNALDLLPPKDPVDCDHDCESCDQGEHHGNSLDNIIIELVRRKATHVIMCGQVMSMKMNDNTGRPESAAELLLCSLMDSKGEMADYLIASPIKKQGKECFVDTRNVQTMTDTQTQVGGRLLPPWA